MAVPFRRTSKTRKRLRRTHFKLSVSGLISCSNCKEMIRSHIICPHCGFYGGKQVLEVSKKKEEEKKAPVTKKAKPKKEKAVKEEVKKVKPTKSIKTDKKQVDPGKKGDK